VRGVRVDFRDRTEGEGFKADPERLAVVGGAVFCWAWVDVSPSHAVVNPRAESVAVSLTPPEKAVKFIAVALYPLRRFFKEPI